MPIPEIEILNSLVSRVFRIEDFTIGDPTQGSIARYRGHLISERFRFRLRPIGGLP